MPSNLGGHTRCKPHRFEKLALPVVIKSRILVHIPVGRGEALQKYANQAFGVLDPYVFRDLSRTVAPLLYRAVCDRLMAVTPSCPMAALGRYRKSRSWGSGRWCGEGHIAGVLRPQYLVQSPLKPAPVVGPNDTLVPVSVSTPTSGQRQLTLHCRHPSSRFMGTGGPAHGAASAKSIVEDGG